MSDVKWMIKAREFVNCNCAYGCPCQFNALPTHGNCEAVAGMQIDQGIMATPRSMGCDLSAFSAGRGRSTKARARRRSSSTSGRGSLSAKRCCVFSAARTPTRRHYLPGFLHHAGETSRTDFRSHRLRGGHRCPQRPAGSARRHRGPWRTDQKSGHWRGASRPYRYPRWIRVFACRDGAGMDDVARPMAIKLADSYAQFAHVNLCQSGIVR